jgi:hypothetical protein
MPRVTSANEANLITAAGWKLSFNESDWLMPNSWLVPDTTPREALSEVQFYKEDGLGIAFFKESGSGSTFAINGFAARTEGDASRRVVANGRARAAVEVAWSIPDQCGESGQRVTGTSLFSVYPDARIIRRDIIDLKSVCSNVIVSSNNTFRASGFVEAALYDEEGNPQSRNFSTRENTEFPKDMGGLGVLCITSPSETSIGMSWGAPAEPRDLEKIELGLFSIADGDAVHMNYIFSEDTSTVANHRYASAVGLFPIRGFSCSTAQDAAFYEFQNPRPLSNATFDHGTGRYILPLGIPALANERVGRYAKFVVGVKTNEPIVHIVRTSSVEPRNGPLDGDDFISQRDPGTDGACFDFTFVFKEPLEAGESLTVMAGS